MKVYESKDIRNVGVVGHGDSGKTTLTAGLLFTAGATNRLLRVDEGNTITDFDEEEISRKISISTAIAVAEWKKTKINILDTPGYNIFINDTRASLVAADAALVLVDGVAGVEVQTEKVWDFANDFKLPRAVVINKLDRERADFARALESVQAAFGRSAVPIQIPVGAERDFTGVVDLVRMKAYTYTADGDGKGKEVEIPADLADSAKAAHEALVEMVAEGNDALMEEFFDKGTLAAEQIDDGLKQAIREMRIFPVLCAGALHNIGSDLILNFIVENLPAPTERDGFASVVDGAESTQKIAETDPASLFVFKTTADPFAGRITYFKVVTGVVKNDATLQNVTRSTAERLAHLSSPQGKTLQPVTELHAGDHRRGSQAEGNADRRYPGRQGRERHLSAGEAAGAFHRLRHRSQVAQRRRPHGQRRPPHPGRGPVAALLPRPADARVSAGRRRPAARGNRGQPAEEALRRGCRPQGAQDSLPRDHSRHGRRAGPSQEADRRARPVRRLLDQDGAPAARRQVRVRQ